MSISFIFAMDRNGAIGLNNKLPWHLPADLAFFKRTTMGHPILMGRKTYESIGKPLPGRENIILTQNPNYTAEGCTVVHTVEEVLQRYRAEELFVTGGTEIFRLFLPHVDKMYITRIDEIFDADVYFPSFDESLWTVIADEPGTTDDRNPYTYRFQQIVRTIYLWSDDTLDVQGELSEEDRPRLIPFLLKDAEPSACVVICPGGGYARRAEHEGAPIAQWLNSLGISAFVLHYRVSPYRHPAPLSDAQQAIRLVRSNAAEYGIDPGRIGILGFSAGGHLAASAGVHIVPADPDSQETIERVHSRPDLMILCYPVISFYEYGHSGSQVNLLGADAPDELVRKMSCELQVTANTPPAFIWHTSDDGGVPVENSLLMTAALRKHRVPVELHCFEHGRHGLGLALDSPGTQAWPGLCAAWLLRQGFTTVGKNE